jgi:WhiB family transcriptional regulator, redox-sensing transcriptional regulator
MSGDWRDLTACRTADPATFFPEPGDVQAEAAAKAVCSGCPVRVPCAEFADATQAEAGIWGGLTVDERARERRRRRRRAASARRAA